MMPGCSGSWGRLIPKRAMPKAKPKSKSRVLKGWREIAEFLGQTVSVAERWQNEGMPVIREGRLVYASPEELTAWVGTERGKKEPIHIASESEDLIADLKQGLSFVHQQKKKRKP
jgi:hypothetical protein